VCVCVCVEIDREDFIMSVKMMIFGEECWKNHSVEHRLGVLSN